MHTLSRRTFIALLSAAVTLPIGAAYPAFANGGNNPAELAKYMNPFQKKQKYLNQSQDRVIKKKSFKANNLPAVQAVSNREIGFFAVIPQSKLADNDFAKQLVANEKVNGLSVTVPWSMLEPSEDKFDWTAVDQLLSDCEAQHKTLILRVATCGVDLPTSDGKDNVPATPKWVLDSGVKTITFTAADGKQHTMPLFWDKDYLAKWSNFVAEMADRYDKNPNIQSIGITGGGFAGGTRIVPDGNATVSESADGKPLDLVAALKKNNGLNQRQLVEHWKYVADVFPKHFQNARLNFSINGPVKGRWGEDALDEIADYLVYRYGERIYLTRQGISSGKHGFDDYRLLLKFKNDTVTGIQVNDGITGEDMTKIAKHALDDSISYAELPAAVLTSDDESMKTAVNALASHIGYQIVNQQVALPEKIAVGQPLKAGFTFINVGAATAKRPERNFDKDTPMSYRVLLELRDADGKPVLQNLHTPPTPTTAWEPGKPVTWEEELKMVDADKHQLPPGQYSVWLSLVDSNAKRKLMFLNATSDGKTTSGDTVEVGKLVVSTSVAETPTASTNDAGAPSKNQ